MAYYKSNKPPRFTKRQLSLLQSARKLIEQIDQIEHEGSEKDAIPSRLVRYVNDLSEACDSLEGNA